MSISQRLQQTNSSSSSSSMTSSASTLSPSWLTMTSVSRSSSTRTRSVSNSPPLEAGPRELESCIIGPIRFLAGCRTRRINSGQIVGERRSPSVFGGGTPFPSLHDRCGWTQKTAFSRSMTATYNTSNRKMCVKCMI